MQQYQSKNTSINSKKVPALFKKIPWATKPNHTENNNKNLDLGGGKYDTATEYLQSFGIQNIIYDPFNRDFNHNLRVVMDLAINPADTATISNVLNVIKEKDKRIELLTLAKRWATMTFISVYEGDKSGIGKETKKGCWQENRKLDKYVEEIKEVFPSVIIKNGIIAAWTINIEEE